MRLSASGIALLRQFEGCRLTAYDDGVGVWTIGYGFTRNVHPGDTMTQEEADRRLVEDELPRYERAVLYAVTQPPGDGPMPTQPQFDAMVSLCYNIGPAAFRGSSVARKFLQRDFLGAADAFLLWDKAGGRVLPGLVKRRAMERALFLNGTIGVQSTPEHT